MLVLTRKPGEKILIGNGITITVVEVAGHRVRIGIDAPNDVRILRGELMQEWDMATRDVEPMVEGHEDDAGWAERETLAAGAVPATMGGRRLTTVRPRKG